MSDKKIIIIAIILALALAAGGWFFTKNKSAGETETTFESLETKTAGLPLGDNSAPVTIEEYTNFLCSACANFALKTLPSIEENYIKTGKVKMVFYVFPPLELSRAAYCADKEGKFIEFHDYFFAHQSQITQEQNIFDFALNIGLPESEFKECYNSTPAQEAANAWLKEGQERGVTATPTFFINGQELVGAKSFEELKKIIDEKLNGS